jgi:hypothetical protein
LAAVLVKFHFQRKTQKLPWSPKVTKISEKNSKITLAPQGKKIRKSQINSCIFYLLSHTSKPNQPSQSKLTKFLHAAPTQNPFKFPVFESAFLSFEPKLRCKFNGGKTSSLKANIDPAGVISRRQTKAKLGTPPRFFPPSPHHVLFETGHSFNSGLIGLTVFGRKNGVKEKAC